jgi:hypothetical protein
MNRSASGLQASTRTWNCSAPGNRRRTTRRRSGSATWLSPRLRHEVLATGITGISPFGWSLSAEQVAIVGELARGVVALPDTDKAEAFAPYAHALSKAVWVRCPAMPEGVADPEYLSLEQIRALT